MELFEEIRREHAHGAGTIRAVAKKLGVHRRMVRQLDEVADECWCRCVLGWLGTSPNR